MRVWAVIMRPSQRCGSTSRSPQIFQNFSRRIFWRRKGSQSLSLPPAVTTAPGVGPQEGGSRSFGPATGAAGAPVHPKGDNSGVWQLDIMQVIRS